MSLQPFQFGLRHLLIIIAVCNSAFFLLVLLAHQQGTREQLPPHEQAVLQSMEENGRLSFGEVPCSFRIQVKLKIRWHGDNQYHVVGIETLGGDELAWISHGRKLSMLRSIRLRGASQYAAQTVQREFLNTPVHVEYWNGKWIPAGHL